MLRRLLLTYAAVASSSGVAPLQYFYDSATATSVETDESSNCQLSTWRPPRGADPAGISGPPFVTIINCSEAKTAHSLEGALPAGAGSVMIYLATAGELVVNDARLTMLGSAYWAQDGGAVALNLSAGATLIAVGGELDLDVSRNPAQMANASYLAPLGRAYRTQDALANNASEGAANVNDEHINDGAALARDLTWSSRAHVEPTHLIVMNCELNGSTVKDHLHPFGAMYISFSGRICFEHPAGAFKCIGSGGARWVSPLLRYLEKFEADAAPDAASVDLVARAGMADCSARPIVFAVNNFDPDDPSGVPNFVDVPDPTRPMVVRSTFVRSVAIEWPTEEDDEAMQEV